MPENLNDLKNLGKESKIPKKPDISSLEKVNNPKPNVTYSLDLHVRNLLQYAQLQANLILDI